MIGFVWQDVRLKPLLTPDAELPIHRRNQSKCHERKSDESSPAEVAAAAAAAAPAAGRR